VNAPPFLRRFPRIASLCAAVLVAQKLAALDATPIPITPRAAWIEPVTLDQTAGVDPALIDDGYYYVLTDRQVNVDPSETYFHGAFKVLNNSGLEDASQIEIEYNPAYEKLEIHGFTVYRDGKALDWSKRVRWKELQRETSLSQGLYDEATTMLIVLEDIRARDVVEYDYSVRGSNPIFGKRFYSYFSYGYDYPMASLSFRVRIPQGRNLEIRQHGRTIPLTTTELANGAVAKVWTEKNSPAVKAEDGVPDWYETYPWIEISEWKTWADVRAWGEQTFASAESPPKDIETAYRDIMDRYEVTHPAATDDDRLIAALRFVQDEIRYFGIEIGANSHRPRTPRETLATRFGDCKDKTTLFCALARMAGFEAWPALVNSTQGRDLGGWLPSPESFDHVIAAVKDGDGWLWFDPTISYQGGAIRSTWVPNYGDALILNPDVGALTPMPKEMANDIDVHEIYQPNGYDEPGTLEVISTYRGKSADDMRFRMANSGRASIESDYLDFYQRSFPRAEKLEDITSGDDRDGNTLVINESYAIPNLWGAAGSRHSLYVYPYTFSGDLSDFAHMGETRSAPYWLGEPKNERHRITVHLPESMRIESSTYASDNPWYRFTYSANQKGDTLELAYRYETLAETVDARSFPSFREKAKDEYDSYMGYTITETTPSTQGEYALPTVPLPLTIALAAATALLGFYVGFHARHKSPE